MIVQSTRFNGENLSKSVNKHFCIVVVDLTRFPQVFSFLSQTMYSNEHRLVKICYGCSDCIRELLSNIPRGYS